MANNRPYMCEGNAIFLPEDTCTDCDEGLLKQIAELKEEISDLRTGLAAANIRINGNEESIRNLYASLQVVIDRTDSMSTDITNLTNEFNTLKDGLQAQIDAAVDSVKVIAGEGIKVEKDGRTYIVSVIDTDTGEHLDIRVDGNKFVLYDDVQKVHLIPSVEGDNLKFTGTDQKVHLKANVDNDTLKLFYNNQ